jgi:hypothetical protein
MKRYLLFIGESYYPWGGMGDFLNDFDTLQQAKEAYHDIKLPPHRDTDDIWANIYDTQERKLVWELTPDDEPPCYTENQIIRHNK